MKEFVLDCPRCATRFSQTLTEKEIAAGRYRRFCSVKCSKFRPQLLQGSIESRKSKVIQSVYQCGFCSLEFVSTEKDRKFCSHSCSLKQRNRDGLSSKGGKSKHLKSFPRSKNEILFADLCREKFENLEFNVPIFNGWDADIIVHDKKIAVLWNGKWHYEFCGGNHSVLQVQTRDRIKFEEIKKCGYEPYIIQDMGSHNPDFVKREFEKFIRGLG